MTPLTAADFERLADDLGKVPIIRDFYTTQIVCDSCVALRQAAEQAKDAERLNALLAHQPDAAPAGEPAMDLDALVTDELVTKLYLASTRANPIKTRAAAIRDVMLAELRRVRAAKGERG